MRRETIDPGSLRVEFSLQQANTTIDGMGGHSESWAEIAKLFGRLEPMSAKAEFGAGQTREMVTHRIVVRWRPDLASGMRFVLANRTFDILTAHDPDETGRYLICNTREVGR